MNYEFQTSSSAEERKNEYMRKYIHHINYRGCGGVFIVMYLISISVVSKLCF